MNCIEEFKNELETRYLRLVEPIRLLPINGKIICGEGTTNIHPKWSPDGKRFLYISNKNNDFFGQTSLFLFDVETLEDKKIKSGVSSAATWHSNGEIIYYSKRLNTLTKMDQSIMTSFPMILHLRRRKD